MIDAYGLALCDVTTFCSPEAVTLCVACVSTQDKLYALRV